MFLLGAEGRDLVAGFGYIREMGQRGGDGERAMQHNTISDITLSSIERQ